MTYWLSGERSLPFGLLVLSPCFFFFFFLAFYNNAYICAAGTDEDPTSNTNTIGTVFKCILVDPNSSSEPVTCVVIE